MHIVIPGFRPALPLCLPGSLMQRSNMMLWMMVRVSNLPSPLAPFFYLCPPTLADLLHILITPSKSNWDWQHSLLWCFQGVMGEAAGAAGGEDKIILVLSLLKMPNTQNFCIVLLQNTTFNLDFFCSSRELYLLHHCIAFPECLQNSDKAFILGSLQALQQGI